MKNKKLLALLLASLTLVSTSAMAVTGCGKKEEEQTHTSHTYGAWEVTTAPTETTTGTATRTCTEGDDTETVTLPALTDSRYVITNDTATETAAGTGTYTITINGETFTFTAATPATGSQTEAATVSSVTVTGDTTVTAGNTLTLTAIVAMSDSSTYSGTITWSSSDESVATVSEGTVTAIAAGEVTITATAGEKSGTITITVSAAASTDPETPAEPETPEEATLTAITITGDTTVTAGNKLTLTASYTMSDGSTSYSGTTTWSSSDTSVATVSDSGEVTAIAAGEVTITVKAGDVTQTHKITVSAASTEPETPTEATVTAITITGDNTVIAGNTLNLSASYTMSDGSTSYGGTTTWSSSDTSIATVSDSGVVTAIAAGTVTITVKAGDVTQTHKITVSAATVTSVEIKGESTSLTVGSTLTLTATATMSNGTTYEGDITWDTSDQGIATVSGGTVTAVAAGNVTITATAGGVKQEYKIVVTEASHEHTYGDYVVTTVPTETTEGVATSTCSGCGGEQTLVLPVLTDSGYYIGNNETDGKSDYTITVSGVELTFTADSIYEDVTTNLDISAMASAVGSTGSITAGSIYGRFTFSGGKMTNSSTYNTGGNTTISFSLTGKTNSLSLTGMGASSTKTVTVTLYKLNDDGTTYTDVTPTDTSVWSAGLGNNETSTFVASGLEAGTYYIETSASLKITDMSITESLEKSNTTGITATASTVDFLVGRSISASDLGLSVTLNYANGRTDSIASGYTTDIANVETSTAGTYTVTITYGDYTAEVSVNIYAIDSITVSDHSMNSSLETINVQTIYLAGTQSLNTAGLAVNATAKCGDLTANFVLTGSEYTISTYDLSTAGTKTITVSASGATATYSVYVLEASENVVKTTVNVSASATAVTEDETSHIVTVNSINAALKLFELWEVSDDVTKTINVAAGTYTEKVYIDMPNVTLIGSNTDKNSNETVIVYDAMNGVTDPSGTTTYSTTGSATVTITENATNFTAKNITFKNYYNTHELYQQALTITTNTQAVACYVEGDMAYFENVTFTSYHDTLEAESGRQYYYNCYIEGRTDYIFGNDATAYFYQCTIHSIGSGDEKNGGYVVATKGSGVDYGYIFNYCTFEGDENVTAGSVSIARGWATGMTIMVMNSTLDDSFSLEGYGYTTSNLNDRYTKMNAEPVASQLFEYNNTGVGALAVTESEGTYTVGTYNSEGEFTALEGYVIGSLSGETFTASTDGTGIIYQTVTSEEGTVTYYPISTIVSAATAADYCDISTIFGLTNGDVKYTDEWAGSNVIYTVDVYYNGSVITTVSVYSGTTLTESAITTAANAALSENSLQVKAIYTDSAVTTAYSEVVLTAATSVYVTTEAKAATISTTYTATYIPSAANTLTASYTGTTDTSGSITVASSGTNGTDSTAGTYTGADSNTYSYRSQIKGYDARAVAITIPENVSDVTITIEGANTNSEARYMVLASGSGVTASTDAACLAMSDGSKSAFEITKSGLSSGTYYIYSPTGDTVYLYAIKITYTVTSSI